MNINISVSTVIHAFNFFMELSSNLSKIVPGTSHAPLHCFLGFLWMFFFVKKLVINNFQTTNYYVTIYIET